MEAYSRREFIRKAGQTALALGGLGALEGCSKSEPKPYFEGHIEELGIDVTYWKGNGSQPDTINVVKDGKTHFGYTDYSHNDILGDHPYDRATLRNNPAPGMWIAITRDRVYASWAEKAYSHEEFHEYMKKKGIEEGLSEEVDLNATEMFEKQAVFYRSLIQIIEMKKSKKS